MLGTYLLYFADSEDVGGQLHWHGAYSGEDEKEGSEDQKTHDDCLEDRPGLNLSWTRFLRLPGRMHLMACCDGTCWNAWNVSL
jgi:hypothetical protein